MQAFVLVCLMVVLSCLASECRFAPVQATAQPRQQVVTAPRERPTIPAPDAAAAWAPAGFRVEVVVRDLIYPTSVEFDDQGNLYVAESGYVYGDPAAPARIWQITPDGEMRPVVEQLHGPVTDILWHDGRLYISHRGRISAWADGQVRDLVTDLPSFGDHHNNQMSVGPDRRIYFGQGTATNSGYVGLDNFAFGWLGQHPGFHDRPAREIRLTGQTIASPNPLVMTIQGEPMLVRTGAFSAFGTVGPRVVPGTIRANGAILRMQPDGSELEVYAWGLRNPFGVMWGHDGRLYVADNGYDDRGSRPIANALDNLWVVREGAWYGWPDFSSGIPVADPQFRPPAGKPAPRFVMAEYPPVEQPWLTRPKHAAVCKIAFAPDGASAAFGNRMYLAEFGDIVPITGQLDDPHRPQVVSIDLSSGGVEPFFHTHDEAMGPEHMEFLVTAGPKRPVGVRFSPTGDALYVADLGGLGVLPTASPMPQPFPGTGVIWRIIPDEVEDVADGIPAGLSPLRGR
jgi:glucose/arabinose dehydrogenase